MKNKTKESWDNLSWDERKEFIESLSFRELIRLQSMIIDRMEKDLSNNKIIYWGD